MADETDSQSPVSTDANKKFVEGVMAQTTRKLAYLLLLIYGICLLSILTASLVFYYRSSAENPDDRWLSVFKDSFAFLSGLLATIIGYYFGNRNVGEALEKARREELRAGQATERAEIQEAKAGEAIEAAKQNEAKAEAFKSGIIEVSAGNDPEKREEPPTSNESALDRPKKDI